MAVYDKLEGELVTLSRVREGGFDALFERMQEPRYHHLAGLEHPPTRDDLYGDLFDDDEAFLVWEMVPEGADEAAGYAFVAAFDGTPRVQVIFFSGKMDLNVGADAMLTLIHAVFEHTEEPRVFAYVPQPVDEDTHERLVEGGFDQLDEHPVANLRETAVYVLERYTYEAYYGDEEDEEAEELDFG